jgi:hypothetical protein
MNPLDNVENLNPTYIENNLETLTGVKRKRLLDGVWCQSAEGTVYRFNRDTNHIDKEITPIKDAETWCSIDFGIAADVFLIWFQIIPVYSEKKNSFIINVVDEYVNNNKDYMHYVDIMKLKEYADCRYCGDPAGRQRDAKLESWFTLMRQQGIIINSKTGTSVADMIENANMYMKYVKINEIQTPKVVEMLENWSYKKDKDGKIVDGSLPEHDVYSHPGTAFYYFFINRFPIKKSTGVYIY